MKRFSRIVAAALLISGFGFQTLHAAQAPAASPTVSQKIAASQNALDINTATPDQLKAIPGIGDAYSKRIIDGRPYTAKNQLVSKGILPQGVYDKIKDQIVAHKVKK